MSERNDVTRWFGLFWFMALSLGPRAWGFMLQTPTEGRRVLGFKVQRFRVQAIM